MSIYNLKKSIERLQESLSKIDKKNFNPEKQDLRKSFFNYQDRKKSYQQESIDSNIKLINDSSAELNDILKSSPNEKLKVQNIIGNLNLLYNKKDFSELNESLIRLHNMISILNIPKKELLFKKRILFPIK